MYKINKIHCVDSRGLDLAVQNAVRREHEGRQVDRHLELGQHCTPETQISRGVRTRVHKMMCNGLRT